MGDLFRLPSWVARPDFSRVTEPFEGLRNPGGSMNPWDMGNDWVQRNLLGNDSSSDRCDPIQRDDVSRHDRDYVNAHREAFGMTEDMPEQDFITEVIAHQVCGESDDSPAMGPNELRSAYVERMHTYEGRDDLSADEQAELQQWEQQSAQLRAWGYNPEITEANEVYNRDTGLYAVRYDPLQEGDEGFDPDANYDPNRGSITSFAGTHSIEDGRVDFDREVGSMQYEADQARIQGLIQGGTGERQTLTGHSLGGYLAQRAAVDATDQIDEVVTYQAGGLSHEHARRFEENRGDIQVRHHSSNEDFVHLAGEERLHGDTYHHHSDDHAFGHLYTLMCGTDEEVMHPTGVDEGNTEGWDEQDRRILEMGRRTISGIRHAQGMTFDPAYYAVEGVGRQAARAALHGEAALDHVMEGGSSALDHVTDATGQAVSALSEGDVSGTLGAVWDGATNLGGDAMRTNQALTREALATAGDLATGGRRETAHIVNHVVDQGGELAQDVLSNAETNTEFVAEALHRHGQFAAAGVDAAAEAGSAVIDAGLQTGANIRDGASNLWNSLWD